MSTNWDKIVEQEVRRIRNDFKKSVLVEVKDENDEFRIYEARYKNP